MISTASERLNNHQFKANMITIKAFSCLAILGFVMSRNSGDHGAQSNLEKLQSFICMSRGTAAWRRGTFQTEPSWSYFYTALSC
jgi:hypothetical protein